MKVKLMKFSLSILLTSPSTVNFAPILGFHFKEVYVRFQHRCVGILIERMQRDKIAGILH